ARIRFGPVALPRGLARGRWVELVPVDVGELLKLMRSVDTAAGISDDDDEFGADPDADWDDYDDPADAIGNRAEPEEARELAPHEIDDEWQPTTSNAHLEGITRQVRSGDGLPGPARGRRGRNPRGRTAGTGFTGPMDHGRTAFGGFDPGAGGQPPKGRPKGKPGGARSGKPGAKGPVGKGSGGGRGPQQAGRRGSGGRSGPQSAGKPVGLYGGRGGRRGGSRGGGSGGQGQSGGGSGA
ncbi:MAG: hypothetical protein WCY32_14610, partial [Burkholderiaceae bacterium]